MARLPRMILVLLALVATAAAEARDPSVRVDRSVIDSLGPPPPAPPAPGGAPRAGGLPLAPDTVPQATPQRRPAQRPHPAPARRATRSAAPALPLPLPPEEPAEAPPLAAPVPLPLPPDAPSPPPPVVAAPAPAAPPSVAAPVPAPPAEVAAPPPTRPAEVAARPPAPSAAAPRAPSGPLPERVQLLFAPEAQELTEAMRAELRALAGALPDSDATRLTVNAYAGGDPANPSLARRASLSRALAVRTALMEAGVRSTRIDVRALGLNAGDGPPDRVDVLVGTPR